MNGIRMPRLRVQLFPLNDDLPQSWQPMEAGRPFTAPFVLRWRAEIATWGPAPAPAPKRYEVRLAGPECQEPVVVNAVEAQADLASVWDRLASGIIRYDIVAFDEGGAEIGCSLLHNFVKDAHPISRLRFPELTLAEGARVGTVEWDTVTGAMMRHLDPFVVTPTIADAAQARRRGGLAAADRARRRLRDGGRAGAGPRRGAGLGPGGRGAVRAAHPGAGRGRPLHRREPGDGVQARLRVRRR